jgi:hypothetical protein
VSSGEVASGVAAGGGCGGCSRPLGESICVGISSLENWRVGVPHARQNCCPVNNSAPQLLHRSAIKHRRPFVEELSGYAPAARLILSVPGRFSQYEKNFRPPRPARALISPLR